MNLEEIKIRYTMDEGYGPFIYTDLHPKTVDEDMDWLIEQVEQLQDEVKGYEIANRALNGLAEARLGKINKLEAEVECLREALELTLPMAKGYAGTHPFGPNLRYVKDAQSLLEDV